MESCPPFVDSRWIRCILLSKEKERLHKRREMEANKSIGTPLIGGPFTLQDTKGNKFTEQNLVDPNNKRFSILYFDSLIVQMYVLKNWINWGYVGQIGQRWYSYTTSIYHM